MKVKKFAPVTPGRRQLVLPRHEELTKKTADGKQIKPHRGLVRKKISTGGRNNLGRITCRHKGGGHKQKYRLIDFKRQKDAIPARVQTIEYDPNRSAYIALVAYADGEKRYVIAPHGLKVGDTIESGENVKFRVGNTLPLKNMPLGSIIHNIELYPGRGGQIVRSAGLSAQLMARSGKYATVKLPSNEVRMINVDCRATLGVVSNSAHNLRVEGKAGRNRWKGIRPTVRGTAMNPVDHPHGGGEGKNKGNIPQTPWAVFTKGTRTRKRKNKYLVKDRRKK